MILSIVLEYLRKRACFLNYCRCLTERQTPWIYSTHTHNLSIFHAYFVSLSLSRAQTLTLSLSLTHKESISSMFYALIFRTKFWHQKLQRWLLGLKFWGQKFCTKNGHVKRWWNWHKDTIFLFLPSTYTLYLSHGTWMRSHARTHTHTYTHHGWKKVWKLCLLFKIWQKLFATLLLKIRWHHNFGTTSWSLALARRLVANLCYDNLDSKNDNLDSKNRP